MSDLAEAERLLMEHKLIYQYNDADIDVLNDKIAEAERERDEARKLIAAMRDEDEETPFEAIHTHIREGVLRAAKVIREHDDVGAAHQIMASAAQRAAGRLNSELKELWDVRAGAERAEADLAEAERRISEQSERIAELYRAQKSTVLSAKSVEYDIGTLQAALAQAERDMDSLRPAVAEIERDEAIARAERAEADLAAAREVISELLTEIKEGASS